MAVDVPLFLDIDGTVTREAGGLDAAIIEVLRDWAGPIVLATGKAFPYPIALCHYLAIPERVVAENGGIVCVDGTVERAVAPDRMEAFSTAAQEAGVDFGWGPGDTVNRWRETEVAIERSVIARERLATLAGEFDLEVVDSGYAYHVKDPAATKGAALERACAILDIDPARAIAIGDSENDVSMFELAGHAVALGNADEVARAAADEVIDIGFATGTASVLRELADR